MASEKSLAGDTDGQCDNYGEEIFISEKVAVCEMAGSGVVVEVTSAA